eukprot:TRINITY_DN13301_c0_g1_i1.p1 TRINITY_DN13301_c0_g1~~TRINITY_DN13301_c0_g1_i1.p1  ORF type:complete len:223 (+),score=69.65 TRINITY_DN13301_c0_g1_i1:38-706(+)
MGKALPQTSVTVSKNSIKNKSALKNTASLGPSLSSAGRGLKKKARLAERRSKFLQNINEVISHTDGGKKEKEKKPTKQETLSSLEDLLSPLLESSLAKSANSSHLTREKRKEVDTAERDLFKNVLAHPAFKSNPLAAITEHVTNSVAIAKKKQAQKEDEDKRTKIQLQKLKKKQQAGKESKESPQKGQTKDKLNLKSAGTKKKQKQKLKKKAAASVKKAMED